MTDAKILRDPITHVLLVVDKSGSMYNLAEDVRGGFNSYVDRLGGEGGTFRLTVALFDEGYIPLCKAASTADTPRLTESNYEPSGCTALLDAIGRTITEFEKAVTLAEGDKVLLVVQTDGLENSSTEYTKDTIAKMVKDREAAGTWACVYMGAGIDAWGQGYVFGMATVDTEYSGIGTRKSYDAILRSTAAYAGGATPGETVTLIENIAGTNE